MTDSTALVPIVGGDDNKWGGKSNAFLLKSHHMDGRLKKAAVEEAAGGSLDSKADNAAFVLLSGEVAVNKVQVDQIIPPVAPTKYGQYPVNAPIHPGFMTGKAYFDGPFSANWKSNPSELIQLAGQGKTIKFNGDTIYNLPEPIKAISNQKWIGDDSNTTVLKYGGSGESVLRAADPLVAVQGLTLAHLKIDGMNTALYGLDARYFTSCLFVDIEVQWVASGGACVVFGGDQEDDVGGWGNTFWKGAVIVPAIGAGFLFDGHLDNGAGARTANNNTVDRVTVNLTPEETSIGFDLVAGDTNWIGRNDVGYSAPSTGNSGLPFMLRAGARQNVVTANRSEQVGFAVLIDGGQENDVTINQFGGKHPTISPCRVIGNPSKQAPNQFIANRYSIDARQPYVEEDGPYGTVIFEDGRLRLSAASGENALEVFSEASNKSWVMGGSGSFYWPAGSDTDYAQSQLLMESTATGALRFGPKTIVRLPIHSPLPTPAVTRSGAPMRTDPTAGVADQVVVALKNEHDTYVYSQIGAPMVIAKTASFTATAASTRYLCNAASGAITVTLPTAVGVSGREYTIKKTDATNNVIVDPNGSQTIDGAATKTITTQHGFLTIVSDGANWLIVASGGTIT